MRNWINGGGAVLGSEKTGKLVILLCGCEAMYLLSTDHGWDFAAFAIRGNGRNINGCLPGRLHGKKTSED